MVLVLLIFFKCEHTYEIMQNNEEKQLKVAFTMLNKQEKNICFNVIFFFFTNITNDMYIYILTDYVKFNHNVLSN